MPNARFSTGAMSAYTKYQDTVDGLLDDRICQLGGGGAVPMANRYMKPVDARSKRATVASGRAEKVIE